MTMTIIIIIMDTHHELVMVMVHVHSAGDQCPLNNVSVVAVCLTSPIDRVRYFRLLTMANSIILTVVLCSSLLLFVVTVSRLFRTTWRTLLNSR